MLSFSIFLFSHFSNTLYFSNVFPFHPCDNTRCVLSQLKPSELYILSSEKAAAFGLDLFRAKTVYAQLSRSRLINRNNSITTHSAVEKFDRFVDLNDIQIYVSTVMELFLRFKIHITGWFLVESPSAALVKCWLG